MASLTEYLDLETLRELQDSFNAASQLPLRICDERGEALIEDLIPLEQQPDPRATQRFDIDEDADEIPVIVDEEVIGRIKLNEQTARETRSPANQRRGRYLRLMADVIGRLCEQRNLLRTRVEELATLYRLTAEFTGQRDLKSLLDVVSDTVVRVLKAKACSIRLLDEERTELEVAAVAKLSPEYLDKGKILLSESQIDQEVLQTLKPVAIADMRQDPRVLYPTEAAEEGLVSGLCAPMVYKAKPEGVIRVYMSEPHEFDWFEVSLLQAIAADAAAAIVNARLHQETARSANIQRQLRLAGIVQRRMIPQTPQDLPGIDIGTVYVPCFELAGDFYDFITLPEDNLGISICDVVGKGVRASLLMSALRAALRAYTTEIYDISEVLDKVNKSMFLDSISSDFATLFQSVLDIRTRRFTYANAGHQPPILFREGIPAQLETGGPVLGLSDFSHYEYESIFLQTGDVVLMYTDGITEALNFKDEAYGRDRMERSALSAIEQGQSANGIVQHVLWEMRRFAGLHTRFDDLTMVAIKVL